MIDFTMLVKIKSYSSACRNYSSLYSELMIFLLMMKLKGVAYFAVYRYLWSLIENKLETAACSMKEFQYYTHLRHLFGLKQVPVS